MQQKSDAQLFREYAEHGTETAFAEIVARHTNLVYSAALRQVDSPDIAAEVAQSVFISLPRGARSLSPRLIEDSSLAGWLCRSARNISLNLRRNEFRRHSRERQVMENLGSISDTTTDWECLRPVLDEAMSELRLDRQVVHVNVLHAGRGFYLDQIPGIIGHGIQHVGTGVAAVEGEGGFIQRAALFEGLF